MVPLFSVDALRLGVLLHHDVQDGPVGLHHAGGADLPHVADGLLRRGAADAVRGLEDHVAHGQLSAHDGGVGGGGQLQCAADLAAVADHAGEVAAHVDDGLADLLVGAAHQPHHGGRGGGGGGDAAPAGGGELAGEDLDVHVQGVGEGQGLFQLLLRGAQVPGQLHHRDDGGDAVVAAPPPG